MRTDMYLEVDGIKMPALKSLTLDEEKIWSTDAGRTLTGEFFGDIVAYKNKLNATFVPCTFEESTVISNIAKRPFVTVKYCTSKGETGQGTFYSGTPSFPFYSYTSQNVNFNGITLNFIEK